MIDALPLLLRITGAGLILLALLHLPMGRRLKWRENAARMSNENAAIFHVHTFFVCITMAMIGLPCLLDPAVFLEKSGAAAWAAWSICGFWMLRLYCQWFVYDSNLWRGKRFETFIHILFSLIWLMLVLVFGACGALQAGWLS